MNRIVLITICFFLFVGTIIPTNVLATSSSNANTKEEISVDINESANEKKDEEQEKKEKDSSEEENSDFSETETEKKSVQEDKDEKDTNSKEEELDDEIDTGSISEDDTTNDEKGDASTTDENDHLALYIEKLKKLGFSAEETSLEETVTEFQTYYQLSVTGELDKIVQTKIDEIYETTLKNGFRDKKTITLKTNLKDLGFGVPGNGTSLFGADTEKKVKKFQEYYDLIVNGIADPVTLERIADELSTPLQFGVRHKDTIQLKKDLSDLGLPVPGNGTSYYGAGTKQIILQFQKTHGLTQSGIVDSLTNDQITHMLDQPMEKGLRRADVVQLKKDLKSLGFQVPGNATNYFGSNTEKKVKQFQEYYGLAVNGVADNVTLEEIITELSTPLQMGKRHKDTVQLKKDLSYLGLSVPGNGTNYYGYETKNRILQLQKMHGLIQNGIVDSLTKEQITYLLDQPMGSGLRRADVIQLKKDLKSIGFQVPGNGTNLFGKQTEAQVLAFQDHYGLERTGVVDQASKEQLQTLLKTPLQIGFRYKDTIKLKRMLAAIGYPVPGKGTNYYGKRTAEKVREFQKDSKLPVSGLVDPITLELLEEMTDNILMYGMRDERVIQLKKDLASIGLTVPGKGTNYYGAETEKKIKQFQKHYELKPSGSADQKTLEKIKDIVSSEMRVGNRNEATIQLKKDLKRLGFSVPGKGTNLYGKQTEKRVKELQKYYGLLESGIADQNTLEKIKKVLASPLQKGKRHKSAVQLKEDLALLGYKVSSKPTTLFAENTEKQLKKFQKTNGLISNGIVDPPTREKIDAQVKKSIVKIFIDPGHGGNDPGASGFGLQEKNLTLDIGLQAYRYLEKNYLGVDVKISRKNDATLKLEDRSKMANDWGADYFISVHTNSHTGAAHGFESYIHNGKVSDETRKRQQGIHDYVIKEIGEYDRGKKTANFNVLRNTNMPAILLEYLFIDNINNNAKLKQRSYRNYLGKVTAEAVAKSFNLKKK